MLLINKIFLTFSITLLTIFSTISVAFSQEQDEMVVDQVVAVVGKSIILESDIQNQYLSYRMQGGIGGTAASIKCQILEDILFQKLMVTQAEVDSIEVSELHLFF